MPGRRSLAAAAGALLLAGAGAAGADEPGKGHVGLYAGLALPRLSSELGPALGVEIQAGVRVSRHLAPFVSVAYAEPGIDGPRADPRVAGGVALTSTRQRELSLGLGLLCWLRPPGEGWNVFVGAGARLYLLATLTDGSAGGGAALGENRETSTQLGAAGEVGVELGLGPGALGATVQVAGSALPHLITGHVETTALHLLAGYRLFF